MLFEAFGASPMKPASITSGTSTNSPRSAKAVLIAGDRQPERLRRLQVRLAEACTEVGRDAAAIRRAVQIKWQGDDLPALEHEVAESLDLGFTDLIVYVDGPQPVKAAAAAAEALPALRALDCN